MCRSQQDKIDELENQIALKIDLSRRLENQLLQANEKAEACLDLQKKVAWYMIDVEFFLFCFTQ